MNKTPRRIKILPPELQNQIAAGEVVERPASVLKELIENSLDAGADSVQVSLEGGGRGLISVQDNGHGLQAQEIELALTRHATSKISAVDDLNLLHSFGFRGEALPSIASVSRLDFFSCPGPDPEGVHLAVMYGRIQEQKPVSLRPGSRVEVRDLFTNTPARLKFLKTQSTEHKKCQEVIQRFALANLNTGFELISGERQVLRFQKGESLLKRLQQIWPESITRSLIQVNFARGSQYGLSGVVGLPDSAQARAGRILLYVNQRPVQDKILLSALREAYKGRLLSREYPQAVLFVTVPGQAVDVNVHPAKSEVRFQEEQEVFALVRSGVLQALENIPVEDSGAAEQECSARNPSRSFQNQSLFRDFPLDESNSLREEQLSYAGPPPDFQRTDRIPELAKRQFSTVFSPESSPEPQTSGYVYLGQVYKTYLLLQDHNKGLSVLDQHAAHERVLFERYKQTGESCSRQQLVLPLEKKLHAAEQSALEKNSPLLRRVGFSFERPSPEQILVRSLPSSLDPQKAREFLEAVLSEQLESLDDIWCLLACRQALKAGEELAREEALQLISAWAACREPGYCPHGRPAMISLSNQHLKTMFKR